MINTRTTAGARVVHLSPDAGAVEVFASSDALASGVEIIDSFSCIETDATDSISYSDVPADDYTLDLAAAYTSIGRSSLPIAISSVQLNIASGYTLVAAGYFSTGYPVFDLLATADSNRSIVTQASVKLVHGAPLAATVGVFVTPADDFSKNEVESAATGAPLLDVFTLAAMTDYVPFPPGDYEIGDATKYDTGIAAINIAGFNLAAQVQ
ncbi:MAG: DUF4397 domain-containing protein [Gammaproteobacteria bacterium]|nr:DUF4397 domain-containing protein [Gammaproteobacteria bacterium]NNJ49825.1 DUF4397 domain-containing protein [Gammaproteobacteria bacterium]